MMDTMEEAPKMNAENMLKVFDLKKKEWNVLEKHQEDQLNLSQTF